MRVRNFPHRRPPAADLLGLVGWVFADLLLALTIVFIGTQPGDPHAASRAAAATAVSTSTTTTSSTTTTTTTAPTSTTLAPGVEKQHVCIVLPASPDALRGPDGPAKEAEVAALRAALEQQLQDIGMTGRRAGIVLAFGVTPNSGEGKPIADAFNGAVLPLVPDTFGSSATRAFWGGAPSAERPRGTVVLNIYPLAEPGAPPVTGLTSDEC